jgi:hypothetical protein
MSNDTKPMRLRLVDTLRFGPGKHRFPFTYPWLELVRISWACEPASGFPKTELLVGKAIPAYLEFDVPEVDVDGNPGFAVVELFQEVFPAALESP